MSFDLQQVPCYDSTNCKEIYNCAPTTSIYTCSNPNPISTPNEPKCPNEQTHLNCFGSDSNYCSGIFQQCNPSDNYNCLPNVSNPALNYFSEYLGCDVKNDPGCLEFENDQTCQNDCWKLGGSKEIGEICNSQFKDVNSCNAMKYFCKWNSVDNVCKEVKEDPWTLFTKNAPQSAGVPKAIFSENVDGYTLDCARSSWSSTDITSYADTVRTCCINKPGFAKKCITTPRCQFVETTCECGFKDLDSSKNPSYNSINSINSESVKKPWFICEDIQQSVIVGEKIHSKKGYCTWCKGTQIQDFDYREWMINNHLLTQGENVRFSDAWGSSKTTDSCSNRCSNYNKCENNESEILWNECIWRRSGGTVGLDPTSNGDLSKGFCYSDNCLESATTQSQRDKCNLLSDLKNVCENELANTISTKNQLYPINPNTGILATRCTEGTNWIHSCIQANNTLTAENYACGWCPNLQNDWPENPCPTNEPTNVPAPLNWFAPLSVFGVKDQTTGIVAVVFITLFALLFIVGFGFFIKWVKSKRPS